MTWPRLMGIAALVSLLWSAAGLAEPGPAAKRRLAATAIEVTPPFADIDLRKARPKDGRWIVERRDASRAELTVDHRLQLHIKKMFERYEVPYGGLVAIEPKTGRVLAYVSHSERSGVDVASDPSPPAASVFKIITGSALVDAGISPDKVVCYGGGTRRLVTADLADNPKRDRSCASLKNAMGWSINAIFAKLSDRHLSRAKMTQYADAFAFGQRLPFDLLVPPTRADIPDDRLERARTAAGFWHTSLSPVHGALLAATIANDGKMPYAGVVQQVTRPNGDVVYRREEGVFRAVLPRQTARQTGRMMTRTVTHGTAKRQFYDRRGRPYLPGIEVAGKTGTLTRDNPFRRYNWWVGYAPLDNPKIALAALVVNEPKWRIKSSYVAREALRVYLRR